MIVGLMILFFEFIIKWDVEDCKLSGFGKKWKDNVILGLIWDCDEYFLNYIMYLYFGGVYYMVVCYVGFNEFEFFFYLVIMLMFFWEYGVEVFVEVFLW